MTFNSEPLPQLVSTANAALDMYAALVRVQMMPHGKECPFAGADMVDAGIGQTAGISDGTTLWFLNDANNTAIAYDAVTRERAHQRDFVLPDCDCHRAVAAESLHQVREKMEGIWQNQE